METKNNTNPQKIKTRELNNNNNNNNNNNSFLILQANLKLRRKIRRQQTIREHGR
jgi:hypothetical protein